MLLRKLVPLADDKQDDRATKRPIDFEDIYLKWCESQTSGMDVDGDLTSIEEEIFLYPLSFAHVGIEKQDLAFCALIRLHLEDNYLQGDADCSESLRELGFFLRGTRNSHFLFEVKDVAHHMASPFLAVEDAWQLMTSFVDSAKNRHERHWGLVLCVHGLRTLDVSILPEPTKSKIESYLNEVSVDLDNDPLRQGFADVMWQLTRQSGRCYFETENSTVVRALVKLGLETSRPSAKRMVILTLKKILPFVSDLADLQGVNHLCVKMGADPKNIDVVQDVPDFIASAIALRPSLRPLFGGPEIRDLLFQIGLHTPNESTILTIYLAIDAIVSENGVNHLDYKIPENLMVFKFLGIYMNAADKRTGIVPYRTHCASNGVLTQLFSPECLN